uniref:3'-5' exonuclease domain-containing protein n=1 Tax=Romanomermis culicivorax TaxID=13658 RepID=A0A915KF82_ROMCU
PLANLAKKKLDIALHGQRYSKGPFAVVIQVCRADGHTIVFDLLEMGIVPMSLINLLQNARGIIGFASNCDLTVMANIDIRFADIKIQADTSQIQRFLKSNRSLDYVRDMNPELYKRLVERTPNFYHTGNSLAAIVQRLFGVHLDKGFQGQGLAWAKRPLPSNALEYAAL